MILASKSRLAVPLLAVAISLLLSCRGVLGETTNELKQLQTRCEELLVRHFNLAEAKPVIEELLARTLEQHGEAHPETVVALHFVAFYAQQTGRYAEAEQ